MQLELAAEGMVVRATLCNGQHSHVMNVFQVPLTHEHIVKKMPMFGQSMYPDGFWAFFLLDDHIGNSELVFRAELE